MNMITQVLYTLSTLPGVQPQSTSESSVVAAKCIPENDILSGAIAPVVNKLTGAIGGILVPFSGLFIVIAAAVAIRLPALQQIRSEVALNAFDRTNLISASLLACAARGEGVPEFHSAMSGVARQNDEILSQSLDLMFERCGESGMAFVLGSMLAFEAFDPEA